MLIQVSLILRRRQVQFEFVVNIIGSGNVYNDRLAQFNKKQNRTDQSIKHIAEWEARVFSQLGLISHPYTMSRFPGFASNDLPHSNLLNIQQVNQLVHWM